ncbi:MAG: NfeD family protein [Prolixibacteraceae bacterium]|nr:NfeD family protein [Prolixibacteraceae bacterium]
MEFEIWHIWIIVAVIFFILEIFIPSFVVFNLGIGSLFAALGASTGLPISWQMVLFSVFTLGSFFGLRPVLKKWAYLRSHQVSTNMDALIGRSGVVIEAIDPQHNAGRVKIDGDVWMARSKDHSSIECNQLVKVTRVDSIVLEVEIFSTSKID